MSTNGRLQRARERWGAQLPDWVEALARAADAEIARGGNLTSLGKRIALSGNQVSGVIGNTHPAGKARDAIEATVRGSLITSEGKGVGVPVAFSLDTAADKTVVTIRDQGGNTVRTIDLGERADGLTQITWDGRDDAGNIQPAGTYSVAVQATNESGSPVVVSQETKGTVQAVSFDKGYPVLHLSTGVSVPVADLLQVDSPPNTSKP